MLIFAIIAFLAACLLGAVGFYRTSSQFAVDKRIERIMTVDVETPEEELAKPFVQRVLLPIGDSVAKLFRGYTPTEVAERTQKKLIMAGLYPRVTSVQLIGLCWFSAAGCLILMFLMILAMGNSPSGEFKYADPWNIVYLLVGAFGGYVLPQFVLGRKVRLRQEQILTNLPYSIDILSISVEAGMGFDAAVGYTMRKIKGPLAEEFSKTLNEIRLGKPRLEALEDLGNRTGVDDLKTFITAVVHASRLGGSITNTLRIQADSIRTRRRQRAQEQAMKAPIKIVFPLVFFIFPALFIVLLGPALVSVYNQLGQ
ncbi:MAG TPA: type II secretion system F family protein [Verrucomicrobiae bacterium]|nr:type II secretion system F family protein [Verrucomicrobiae bacterium]